MATTSKCRFISVASFLKLSLFRISSVVIATPIPQIISLNQIISVFCRSFWPKVDKVDKLFIERSNFLDLFLNPRTCGRTDAPVALLFLLVFSCYFLVDFLFLRKNLPVSVIFPLSYASAIVGAGLGHAAIVLAVCVPPTHRLVAVIVRVVQVRHRSLALCFAVLSIFVPTESEKLVFTPLQNCVAWAQKKGECDQIRRHQTMFFSFFCILETDGLRSIQHTLLGGDMNPSRYISQSKLTKLAERYHRFQTTQRIGLIWLYIYIIKI